VTRTFKSVYRRQLRPFKAAKRLNALGVELDIPEIDCDLRSLQEDAGAVFEVFLLLPS
jgi:hypothetical protein